MRDVTGGTCMPPDSHAAAGTAQLVFLVILCLNLVTFSDRILQFHFTFLGGGGGGNERWGRKSGKIPEALESASYHYT